MRNNCNNYCERRSNFKIKSSVRRTYHQSVLSGESLTALFHFHLSLQLQDLPLQKQQRVNDLTSKALDFLNTFLINLVCDIGTASDLVDIIGNIIGDAGDLFQFVLVDLSDVSLKDHRPHKSAECFHATVPKLSLDSVHFCLTHSYFQVQCTLLFIFHFFCSPFFIFLNLGS